MGVAWEIAPSYHAPQSRQPPKSNPAATPLADRLQDKPPHCDVWACVCMCGALEGVSVRESGCSSCGSSATLPGHLIEGRTRALIRVWLLSVVSVPCVCLSVCLCDAASATP